MDYPDFYTRASAPFRKRAAAVRALNVLDKLLVAVVAAAYLGCAVWLAFERDARIVRFLAVPAACFATVTIVRAAANRPRPYELYDIDPLIHKDTRGKSFPSRHISSAVVIACALAWLGAPAGAAAFAAAAVVCACRVIGGVHFPRDVAAAVAIALAFGIAGFWALP